MAVRFDIDSVNRETIYRTLTVVVSVALILWGCLIILKPFLPAFLLAIIFTLSTWPAYTWLKDRLGGKRTVAAFLMTLLLALCFLLPLIFLGSSIADNFSHLYNGVLEPILQNPGDAPTWMKDLPWIGSHVDALWTQYVTVGASDMSSLKTTLGPKLIAVGAVVGSGVLDVALGVLIAFFFFRHGVTFSARAANLLHKFAGPRAHHLLTISKKTIIGVVYGVLGTALAQGAFAGFGLWLAGVPGATFLGLVTILLSFVPMGPPLVWLPASIWLFYNDMTGAGAFLLGWGIIVVSGIDNIIRPYFISLGTDLPLPLVLLGVFGGLLAFGFIGLFIGPTLLAVAYSLVIAWSKPIESIESAADIPTS